MNDPTRPETILRPDKEYARIGYTNIKEEDTEDTDEDKESHVLECTKTRSGVNAYINGEKEYGVSETLDARLGYEASIEDRLDDHEDHADPQRRFANIKAIDSLATHYVSKAHPLAIHPGRKTSFDVLDDASSLDIEEANQIWQEPHRRTLTRQGYAVDIILEETSRAADTTLSGLKSDQKLLATYAGNDDAPKQLNDHRNADRSLQKTVKAAINNVCDVKQSIDRARTLVYKQIMGLTRRFPEREREELQAQYRAAGRKFHDQH